MRALVEELCSDRCAGRAAGSPGGRIARGLVIDALREAGLDPHEQPIARFEGANVLATIPGDLERFVLVGAHYDHLGKNGPAIYRGADDNAAAIAVLVEMARALAEDRPRGRGVIIAAFDAEEPPHFMNGTMGSLHFTKHPLVPLERIDLMVCLELVGHALGEAGLPTDVRRSLFVLGGERSVGTREQVLSLAREEPGLIVRPADAEVIPPLSDYLGFWKRKRPFVLLTGGRTRRYHTTDDRPEHLDWTRMKSVARWLERFVRAQCARDERPFEFVEVRDDLTTLDSLRELFTALAPTTPLAAHALEIERALRAQVQRDRSLPEHARGTLAQLVEGLETGLA
ncbi:MAG: M28 family peptidase [Sandaracinaceae bacterium]|nr:M28 family peptidase [Sandaracinaceae bacterium]